MVQLDFPFISLLTRFMVLKVDFELAQVVNFFYVGELLSKSFVLLDEVPPTLIIFGIYFNIILF